MGGADATYVGDDDRLTVTVSASYEGITALLGLFDELDLGRAVGDRVLGPGPLTGPREASSDLARARWDMVGGRLQVELERKP